MKEAEREALLVAAIKTLGSQVWRRTLKQDLRRRAYWVELCVTARLPTDVTMRRRYKGRVVIDEDGTEARAPNAAKLLAALFDLLSPQAAKRLTPAAVRKALAKPTEQSEERAEHLIDQLRSDKPKSGEMHFVFE